MRNRISYGTKNLTDKDIPKSPKKETKGKLGVQSHGGAHTVQVKTVKTRQLKHIFLMRLLLGGLG